LSWKSFARSPNNQGVGHLSIAIVGLGYVGLSTAVIFASKGLQVIGYDVDAAKVARINNGNQTIHEPPSRGLAPCGAEESRSVHYSAVGLSRPVDAKAKVPQLDG
jgi:UDP-N-acetyl-D-mannosaminuronate dehydrogenase